MKAVMAAMAGLVIVASVACGSKSGPAAPSTPVVQVYTESRVGTVSSFGAVFHDLTTTRSGNLTITLTWTGSADMDLYLTAASCNVYPLGNCQMMAVSDGLHTVSEQVKRSVSSGETFKMWVDNFAAFPVNYTLQIRID